LSVRKNERFIIFGINYFCGLNNSRKVQNYYSAVKNTLKASKIQEKFPKTLWNMRKPNKVFRAHDEII
jgi:hypothetical protein